MAEVVYIACALTSLFCAALLARAYARQRTRLLMWAMWCFIGLALDNVLLVIDLLVVPETDLSVLRVGSACIAMAMLLVGLIWESR